METRWRGSQDAPNGRTPARDHRGQVLLFAPDEEHPDTWMTHETSGCTLAFDEDGIARLSDPQSDVECEMQDHDAPAERSRCGWHLPRSGPDAFATQAWVAVHPPVDSVHAGAQAPSKRQDVVDPQERAFYDSLGVERIAVPCRRPGCATRRDQLQRLLPESHHCEQLREPRRSLQETEATERRAPNDGESTRTRDPGSRTMLRDPPEIEPPRRGQDARS